MVDGRIWSAGPPGGGVGRVVAVDPAAVAVTLEADFAGSVVDLAVNGNVVWLARGEGDQVGRLAIP